MTVITVMDLPSMTVIIVMELHSMTVIIVMTKRPRDAYINRRHVMPVCVDYVYEGHRNDCAYAWVMWILRTNGLYEFCVHLV